MPGRPWQAKWIAATHSICSFDLQLQPKPVLQKEQGLDWRFQGSCLPPSSSFQVAEQWAEFEKHIQSWTAEDSFAVDEAEIERDLEQSRLECSSTYFALLVFEQLIFGCPDQKHTPSCSNLTCLKLLECWNYHNVLSTTVYCRPLPVSHNC